MRIFTSVHELQSFRNSIDPTIKVGFVPTMGALHQGHIKLVGQARKDCDISIVSLFVNPTQFNNANDLKNYPKDTEQDLKLLSLQSVDVVFIPEYSEIYADNYNYKVTEEQLSPLFCGAHRPGHFSGVLTVVLKLFNLTQPHKAYFGLKDYQQFLLIKNMVKSLFLPIEVVGVDIVREESGLAMSSRNKRLSETARRKASYFFEALKSAPSAQAAKSLLESNGFAVDYIEEYSGRRLGAIEIENIRLIDNVEI